MDKNNDNYRRILYTALETRCAKNPRYSLRAFARDLEISPARLSDVLRGRYGLSVDAANKISKILGHSKSETKHFADLVESEHARSPIRRLEAQKRLAAKENTYQQLGLDGFQIISEWYHYAILELLLTEGSKSETAWIAARLSLSRHLVDAALARLKRLGLLEELEDGSLKPGDEFTASPDGIPNEAIKKFHRQILEKAILAIDFQSVQERDISNMILAIDEKDLSEAKDFIRDFRRSFDRRFGRAVTKTHVYNLSIQFFSLQERGLK